jgi:hypothetical protein
MLGMTTQITHLRGLAALRPLRGRHPVVVVCRDDPAPFEARREELGGLDAKLVVDTVRWLEIRCEECPQSGVDMGQSAGDRSS